MILERDCKLEESQIPSLNTWLRREVLSCYKTLWVCSTYAASIPTKPHFEGFHSFASDNSIEYQKRANFPENIEFSGIFFILMSMVLAVGRAMGETMAVMMVMG